MLADLGCEHGPLLIDPATRDPHGLPLRHCSLRAAARSANSGHSTGGRPMTMIETKQIPEPPVPAGHRASDWLRWTQINTAAYMVDMTQWECGENFALSAKLHEGIAKGIV